jgi:hypothetical protein
MVLWEKRRRIGAELSGHILPAITCNALNLGVDFFSSFLSPNSGVTLSFSLFFSLSLDLFQSRSGFWL